MRGPGTLHTTTEFEKRRDTGAVTSPRKLKGSGKAQRITRAPPKAALPETGPARNQLLWLGLVLVATCITYLPLFKATFLNYDDDIYVTENPFVRNLDINNLKALFSTIYQNQYAPVAMF